MNKIFALIVAVFIVATDTFADRIINKGLAEQGGGSLPVTPFFNLVSVQNTGVSFGLLQEISYGRWVLLGLSLIITAALVVWLFRTSSLVLSCALGLVIGGAVGNMIERARYGAVFDFLDFHAYGWHWPAFNFTDSAIVIGMFLLIFYEFMGSSVKEAKNIG
ncbi:MAG: signal peptidase II [Planctomycetaceae bacterium]|nr:signal peptidase II [Planctomycetaceae bacterium]